MSANTQSRTIAVLVAVQFLHMVDFIVVMPLGPQLMPHFSISPQAFSLLVASYSLGAAGGGLLGALWMDRFDRRHALIALMGGFVLAAVACAAAPTFAVLLIGRFLAGLCGGGLDTLCFTIVGDAVDEQRRASATGALMGGMALATVAGVPAGLALSTGFDWRGPFYMVALLGAAMLPLASLLLPPMSGHREARPVETAWRGLVQVLRIPRHRGMLLAMVALVFATFSVPPYLATYYVSNLGVSPAHLPLYYIASGAAAVLSAPLLGWLADRHGRQRVFTGIALAALLPLLVVTRLPPVHAVLIGLVGAALFACITSCYAVSGAIVASGAHPAYRGRFMSLETMVEQLGMAAVTALTGLLVSEDAQGRLLGFGSVGLFGACAMVIALLLFRCLDTVPAMEPGAGAPHPRPTTGGDPL